MEAQTYAQDFFAYINAPDAPEVMHTFPARAVIRPDLPHVLGVVPEGTLVVWPDYLAFLSDAKRSLHDYGSMPWDSPALLPSPLIAAAKKIAHRVKGEESSEYLDLDEQIERSLQSPATLFIPLDKLTGIEAGSRYGWHWIRLIVDGTDIYICEETGDYEMFEGLKAPFAPWEKELTEALLARAQVNAQAAIPEAQMHAATPAPQ